MRPPGTRCQSARIAQKGGQRWLAALSLGVLAAFSTPPARAVPREPVGVPPCALPPQPLSFRFGTGSMPSGSATVGEDGTAYVGTREGYLHAVSPEGRYLWGYTLKGAVTGRPIVGSSGAVLVPTARRVYAIRPDGSLLWVFESPIRVLGDLARDGLGRFNFGTDDGRIFSLSGRGALVAHVPGRVPFSVLPVALPDGAIAAARRDGSVLVSRGAKLRRYDAGGSVRSLFACPGGELCAIVAGQLRALGPAAVPWQVSAVRAAANAQRVAVLSDDHHLELYRGLSGERLFTFTLPDAASATPVLDEKGRVFVSLKGGALLLVSPEGIGLACTQIGNSPLGAPTLDGAHGRVLVTALEGVLASLELP